MPNPILRFKQMPAVSNRPQRALNGREYRIDRIAMPFCWAVEIGVDDGRLYRLMIEEGRGTHARPCRGASQPEPGAGPLSWTF
jgi:hypothetical protein